MAGCVSCGEGGNVSPDSIRKWTERLSNILVSSSAREKFHEYLESRNLEDGQRLLEFWEKCNSLLLHAENPAHNTRGWKRRNPEKSGSQQKSSHPSKHRTLKEEAESIVEFASVHINFDSAQMDTLYSAVQSGNNDQIIGTIRDTRQISAEMLEEEGYREYCRFLLKSQGKLKQGK